MSLIDKLFPARKFKFRGPDKTFQRIDSPEFNAEYRAAEAVGRVSFGENRFFYRDLGVRYYCPYDYIERAFTRISECQPDDSPAYYYYRLILVHGEKEFANLIFNEEKDCDEAIFRLQKRNSDMAVGYLPPADGKRRARFM